MSSFVKEMATWLSSYLAFNQNEPTTYLHNVSSICCDQVSEMQKRTDRVAGKYNFREIQFWDKEIQDETLFQHQRKYTVEVDMGWMIYQAFTGGFRGNTLREGDKWVA